MWHQSISTLERRGRKELICGQAQRQFYSGTVSDKTGIPQYLRALEIITVQIQAETEEFEMSYTNRKNRNTES